MLEKFTSDQLVCAFLGVLVFIVIFTMVITTHRTSMACIDAGKTPSSQLQKRCEF